MANARARARGFTDGVFVRLLDPHTWRPLRQHRMLDGESVLALRPIILKCSSGAGRGADPFVAAATAMAHGEDFAVYGRIVLLSVVKKPNPTPEEALLGRVWDFKVAFSQQFRGAVTDVQESRGQLVACVGSRIEVMAWSGTTLVRRLFLDRQDMVGLSLKSRDNLLVVADAVRGVRVVEYDEEGDRLNQLGVAVGRMQAHAVELLSAGDGTDGGVAHTQTVAVSDSSGLLHILSRHPGYEWSGQQMRLEGSVFLGTVLERLVPLPLPSASTVVQPNAILGVALDGSIHFLTALAPQVAQGIRALLRRAATALPQNAGLHPLAFRATRTVPGAPVSRPGFALEGAPGPDSVLDGDLLRRVAILPAREQAALAPGVQVEQACVDLMQAWTAVL